MWFIQNPNVDTHTHNISYLFLSRGTVVTIYVLGRFCLSHNQKSTETIITTSPPSSLLFVISKNVGIFERIFAFERGLSFFPVAGSFWWLGRHFIIIILSAANVDRRKENIRNGLNQ